MAPLLLLISCLAAFAATALLIYGLLSQATRSFEEGTRRAETYLAGTGDRVKANSLLGIASKYGVMFLPINERMRESGTLGAPLALARWEEQLVRAGLRTSMTPEQFLGICEVSAIATAIIFMLVATLFGVGPVGALILGGLIGGFVGFIVPVYMLNTAAAERVARIDRRLPYAIEFMLLAMEATAALPEAIAVYRDLMPGDALAEEFDLVLKDIERGSSQIDALKSMGERIESDSLSAFLLAVNVGLDTGQPIKDVLQTQADATRVRRYQNAEEVAKTAGTKALLPLFIVVIGILMLVLGPMAIRAMTGGLW